MPCRTRHDTEVNIQLASPLQQRLQMRVHLRSLEFCDIELEYQSDISKIIHPLVLTSINKYFSYLEEINKFGLDSSNKSFFDTELMEQKKKQITSNLDTQLI